MFSLIEALNFRCLRYVRQPLGPFHVLVGPNASGKSTFLDVVSFLSDFVAEGLDAAISNRTSDLRDLFWTGQGSHFELAVEAVCPVDPTPNGPKHNLPCFRYEVGIGIDHKTKENAILYEMGRLKSITPTPDPVQRSLFPRNVNPPVTLRHSKQKEGKLVFSKRPGQNDNYYPEPRQKKASAGWVPAFKLGPRRSTLANLPEDESRFPVATWFKELLTSGVQNIVLNGRTIQLASPPGQAIGFKPDGANLPWVIKGLEETDSERFRDWTAHLRTALPDIHAIATRERQDDRSRYLVVQYDGGVEVPSWLVSEGTLRLMALTLPAYLPNFSGVYLVEEPENGIHPRAVETMFQSLSSVYGAQILMATHSPVILSLVDADKVLCFATTREGGTDIVRGTEHPRLTEWRGEESLGVLFAAGVLG